MVVHLLTGVIVGILIGLAIAPAVQAWVLWQQARSSEDADLRSSNWHGSRDDR